MSDRREFLLELDATEESFVRQKLALGGYTTAEGRVVNYWIAKRDKHREDEHRALETALARRRAFWTTARGIASVVGLVLAAFVHWFSSRPW